MPSACSPSTAPHGSRRRSRHIATRIGCIAREIGVEPGPELRELQEAILRHDPALDARPLQQELPRQLEGGTSAPCRAEARAALAAQALGGGREEGARAALVGGPDGIGKTRLAAELATEVQRTGGGALRRDAAPRRGPEAVRDAEESELPTLLVLDDADVPRPP